MLKTNTDLVPALKLSGPMIGASLAQFSLTLIDNLMCGRLGPTALAGAGLGAALFATLFLPLMGILAATAPMIAQAQGADNDQEITQTVHQAFFLSWVLFVPMFLCLSWGGPFLLWMGQPPELVLEAENYLLAVRWSVLPSLWVIILRQFLDSLSQPRPGFIIALTAIVMNIVANRILMFGEWGFPALGVAGTGWATGVVQFWKLSMLTGVIQMQTRFRRYNLFAWPGFQRKIMHSLLKVGLPMGFTYAAEVWLFTGLTFLMGYFGKTALAAHQIAITSASFTFMIAMGISNASTVRVAQAVGKKDWIQARQAGLSGMQLGILLMGMSASLFYFLPSVVVWCFIDIQSPENQGVLQMATVFLGLAAAFQVFDALQVTSQGALRGLKDTFYPMLISFGCYWGVGLGSAIMLAFVMNLGAPGLWVGLVLGLLTAGALLSRRFFRYFNSSKTPVSAHSFE